MLSWQAPPPADRSTAGGVTPDLPGDVRVGEDERPYAQESAGSRVGLSAREQPGLLGHAVDPLPVRAGASLQLTHDRGGAEVDDPAPGPLVGAEDRPQLAPGLGGELHLDSDHGATGRHQDQVRPVHRLGTGRDREEFRRSPGHRLGGAGLALGEYRSPCRLQGEADVGEGQAVQQPLARAGGCRQAGTRDARSAFGGPHDGARPSHPRRAVQLPGFRHHPYPQTRGFEPPAPARGGRLRQVSVPYRVADIVCSTVGGSAELERALRSILEELDDLLSEKQQAVEPGHEAC